MQWPFAACIPLQANSGVAKHLSLGSRALGTMAEFILQSITRSEARLLHVSQGLLCLLVEDLLEPKPSGGMWLTGGGGCLWQCSQVLSTICAPSIEGQGIEDLLEGIVALVERPAGEAKLGPAADGGAQHRLLGRPVLLDEPGASDLHAASVDAHLGGSNNYTP